MATMCPFPPDQHVMTHWKFVLHCCAPSIFICGQESIRDETNTCPTICFHVYRLFSCCIVHGIHTYKGKIIRSVFLKFHKTIQTQK